jgi:predicted nucleic acid-binding protein
VTNPRTQEEAVAEIEKYLKEEHLLKLYPGPDILDIMLDLLRHYEIKRQAIFDLQLVAAMLSNNIKRIYTFNQGHFEKFTEIEALEPSIL